MALWKNNLGEYNYQFHWMNEKGVYVGFNDVWAPTMAEARKRAKLMETKAHWALYSKLYGKYITVPKEVKGGEHCFRMTGMYIMPSSFKKASYAMGWRWID